MTHAEFHRLLSSIMALSPEKIRQLRDKLDREIAEADARQAAAIPTTAITRKPIWEEILEMTADIPDEEWDTLRSTGLSSMIITSTARRSVRRCHEADFCRRRLLDSPPQP